MFDFSDDFATALTPNGVATAIVTGSRVSVTLHADETTISTDAPILTTPEAAALDAYEWAVEQLASERALLALDEVMA
jgi:hypothetical protein